MNGRVHRGIIKQKEMMKFLSYVTTCLSYLTGLIVPELNNCGSYLKHKILCTCFLNYCITSLMSLFFKIFFINNSLQIRLLAVETRWKRHAAVTKQIIYGHVIEQQNVYLSREVRHFRTESLLKSNVASNFISYSKIQQLFHFN